jgi:hypothetical protein
MFVKFKEFKWLKNVFKIPTCFKSLQLVKNWVPFTHFNKNMQIEFQRAFVRKSSVTKKFYFNRGNRIPIKIFASIFSDFWLVHTKFWEWRILLMIPQVKHNFKNYHIFSHFFQLNIPRKIYKFWHLNGCEFISELYTWENSEFN